MALRQVTDRFIYLEEGDLVRATPSTLEILDRDCQPVNRQQTRISEAVEVVELGEFDHFMLKEIYEQPRALAATFAVARGQRVSDTLFGAGAAAVFDQVKAVQIVACGTSYHAGFVAKYWIEALLGIPCQIEVASEFRYRKSVVPKDTLFVTLSQSGETLDTLEALRNLSSDNYCGSLSICNVPESPLVRESLLVLMTRAGPEIGVASTKAFTTQLVSMLLLVIAIGKLRNLEQAVIASIVKELIELPRHVEQLLRLDAQIEKIAEDFVDKQDALFLGRGEHYPIAMEGALKLKEISYIHAEAYPAGELKHGPLALVDSEMPVIVVTPNDELLEKLQSNMQEVKARGGKLYVFAHQGAKLDEESDDIVVEMNCETSWVTPILSTIPLQLLSYHVAVLRGTDVDQPRNLAKSVTVE
jgi:glucosamine--fructose-6-phosphate aminotransferase (isomerizing)